MNEKNGLTAFLDWLKSNNRTEEEKIQCKLLDGYMMSRQNKPGTSLIGNDLVKEPRTTSDIADDLSSMYPMDEKVITSYMFLHEFTTTTLDDGTVAWAIWRDITPLM